jgi:hypothetical protein
MLLGLTATAAPAQDWKPIRDALGREGKVDEGILRITFPRSDLKVSLNGVPVSVELAGLRAALDQMNVRGKE